MSRNTAGAISVIELLILVVIVGILLSMLIPRLQTRRQLAVIHGLQEDLVQVVEAQEAYLTINQRYAASADSLALTLAPEVTVTIGGSGVESGTGWYAVARNEARGLACYVGIGVDTVVDRITLAPNRVTCDSVTP